MARTRPEPRGRWRFMVIDHSPLIPTHLNSYPVCRLGAWMLVPDRWNTDGEKRAGYLCDGSERVSLAHTCDILVAFVQALHRVEDHPESAPSAAA